MDLSSPKMVSCLLVSMKRLENSSQSMQLFRESIDNQVTTRPSAILRQGTDVTSNDPRLNIPGTPENLI